MREIRPSGSEGGARSSILVPTPIYRQASQTEELRRSDTSVISYLLMSPRWGSPAVDAKSYKHVVPTELGRRVLPEGSKLRRAF